MKVVTENRQAKFEYFIDETYTCGIVLEGAEVKSIRSGAINLKDSFCTVYKGEVFLKNAHISVYEKQGAFNSSDSKRDRKLLLRRAEINKILGKVSQNGYTLVPLLVYFEGSLVKVKIGLCKGKHTFDKKKSIKEKDLQRYAERQINEY